MLESRTMPTDGTAGFWSYAHGDNELDDGAILELARLLMEEYDLLSGEPLELFIDRANIVWGEQWRNRIDAALTQTTFFIPIITPRYFNRSECRRELLEFTAKAKSLGVEELVLPILYVAPKDFSAESGDEAVSLIAKVQYEDWRTRRLLEPSSREYRTAVNGLARRLMGIAGRVAERQLRVELSTDSDDRGADGIVELMEEVGKLLPSWLDAVRGERINHAQINATIVECASQWTRLQKSRAAPSAQLAAKIRHAKAMLPLAERARTEAQVYVSRSVELDPLISALARFVDEHPEGFTLIRPLRDALDEAVDTIREGEGNAKREGWRRFSENFKSDRHLGRIFQTCNAVFADTDRLASEGNDIVERWDTELGKQPDGADKDMPDHPGAPPVGC